MRLVAIHDLHLLFVMVLMKATGWLPSSTVREWLLTVMSRGAYYLDRGTRLKAEKNLSIAFEGKLSDDDVHRIVKEALRAYWVEPFSLLPSEADRRALQDVRVQGIEHLRRPLESGKGVILWESAFGRRVLAKQVLSHMGFVLHQIHAESHIGEMFGGYGPTSWVRRRILLPFFESLEKEFATEIIYLSDSGSLGVPRLLLRLLRENAIIVSSADGVYGERLIPVECLGQTRPFATGMVSLARLSGAPILPVFCAHERDGTLRLTIEPSIDVQREGSRDQAIENSLSQYARLLESYVKKYPEQYRVWFILGGSGDWTTAGKIIRQKSRPISSSRPTEQR